MARSGRITKEGLAKHIGSGYRPKLEIKLSVKSASSTLLESREEVTVLPNEEVDAYIEKIRQRMPPIWDVVVTRLD
ncbi:hypothetical protein CLV24_11983 [Pontibacter ummariensis]|uniref:Uncharacterized protein n=1 Tax=Pontibacter ummariensis TaxID=1610492 RepID=A0A239IZD3_9BACT|nr:hypothetical protein [Pontibacter ummariensis]PRY09032.1 hypothetical protein CLV24_11983 [Pontibacter ummariensis]SNS98752.1 hypothetical protein SAMN06296052_11983 [Pontibacter ummariensis]